MGKVPEYNRRAIDKYNSKFDRCMVNLPAGSKDKIKELTGDSVNKFLSRIATEELERLEALKDQEQPQRAKPQTTPDEWQALAQEVERRRAENEERKQAERILQQEKNVGKMYESGEL